MDVVPARDDGTVPLSESGHLGRSPFAIIPIRSTAVDICDPKREVRFSSPMVLLQTVTGTSIQFMAASGS